MLTVVALRRIGAEAAAAAYLGPADDAWTRLRQRIERSSRKAREQAWRWRTSLGGLATASLLVAAVVGPATIRVTSDTDSGEGSSYSAVQLDRLDWSTELQYVSAARTYQAIDAPPGFLELSGGVIQRTMYPDGIRPVRKEVQPARATTGLPEAR
jgi:hypothetical protein